MFILPRYQLGSSLRIAWEVGDLAGECVWWGSRVAPWGTVIQIDSSGERALLARYGSDGKLYQQWYSVAKLGVCWEAPARLASSHRRIRLELGLD